VIDKNVFLLNQIL